MRTRSQRPKTSPKGKKSSPKRTPKSKKNASGHETPARKNGNTKSTKESAKEEASSPNPSTRVKPLPKRSKETRQIASKAPKAKAKSTSFTSRVEDGSPPKHTSHSLQKGKQQGKTPVTQAKPVSNRRSTKTTASSPLSTSQLSKKEPSKDQTSSKRSSKKRMDARNPRSNSCKSINQTPGSAPKTRGRKATHKKMDPCLNNENVVVEDQEKEYKVSSKTRRKGTNKTKSRSSQRQNPSSSNDEDNTNDTGSIPISKEASKERSLSHRGKRHQRRIRDEVHPDGTPSKTSKGSQNTDAERSIHRNKKDQASINKSVHHQKESVKKRSTPRNKDMDKGNSRSLSRKGKYLTPVHDEIHKGKTGKKKSRTSSRSAKDKRRSSSRKEDAEPAHVERKDSTSKRSARRSSSSRRNKNDKPSEDSLTNLEKKRLSSCAMKDPSLNAENKSLTSKNTPHRRVSLPIKGPKSSTPSVSKVAPKNLDSTSILDLLSLSDEIPSSPSKRRKVLKDDDKRTPLETPCQQTKKPIYANALQTWSKSTHSQSVYDVIVDSDESYRPRVVKRKRKPRAPKKSLLKKSVPKRAPLKEKQILLNKKAPVTTTTTTTTTATHPSPDKISAPPPPPSSIRVNDGIIEDDFDYGVDDECPGDYPPPPPDMNSHTTELPSFGTSAINNSVRLSTFQKGAFSSSTPDRHQFMSPIAPAGKKKTDQVVSTPKPPLSSIQEQLKNCFGFEDDEEEDEEVFLDASSITTTSSTNIKAPPVTSGLPKHHLPSKVFKKPGGVNQRQRRPAPKASESLMNDSLLFEDLQEPDEKKSKGQKTMHSFLKPVVQEPTPIQMEDYSDKEEEDISDECPLPSKTQKTENKKKRKRNSDSRTFPPSKSDEEEELHNWENDKSHEFSKIDEFDLTFA